MEYGERSHAEHNLVWLAIVLAFGLLLAFVVYTFWPSSLLATSVSVGPKTFHASVADDEATRAAGVTQLTALAEDQAMLMVYDYDAVWPMTTKDNKFPIDIAWVSSDKRVAYTAKNAKPSRTDVYTPGGKSRYVLLLPAGSVTKYGIYIGKQVGFEYGG